MIDILLATFNGERYLSEQIDSILYQTFDDWNLLISDDGSSDETLDIIRHYESIDERVHCINWKQRLGGACPNFMFLLRNSTSPYCMFCDQDDVWLPNKIEDSVAEMQRLESIASENEPILVFTDMAVVDKNLAILNPSFEAHASIDPKSTSLSSVLSNPIAAGCTMLLNAPLRDLVLQTPSGQAMDMHDWWITLVAAAFGTIGHVDSQTNLYRQHDSNEFGAIEKTYLKSFLTLRNAPQGILKILAQAESFYEVYGEKLSPQDRDRVRALASVRDAPRLTRLPLMLRSKSWKHGVLRSFGEAVIINFMSMGEYPLNHC